ncbi:hypothetical protein ACOME3_005799 [Neoechinorhynchus agilis]
MTNALTIVHSRSSPCSPYAISTTMIMNPRTGAETFNQLVNEIRLYYEKLNSCSGRQQKQVAELIKTCLARVDETTNEVEFIGSRVREFDPHPDIKTNGYRSLVKVYAQCITRLLGYLSLCSSSTSGLFRNGWTTHMKKVKAWSDMIIEVSALIMLSAEYLRSSNSLLVPRSCLSEETVDRFVKCALTTKSVFGRPIAFQYPKGMRRSVGLVCSAMISYKARCPKGKCRLPFAKLVPTGAKWIFDPDARVNKAHEAYLDATIGFCKTLFTASDNYLLKRRVQHVYGKVTLNKVIELGNKEIMTTTRSIVPGSNNSIETVTLPSDSLSVLLMSHGISNGALEQHGLNDKDLEQPRHAESNPPRTILFHLHGGGFITESVSAQEVYMRTWAQSLKVPLLSECFYAYIWTLESRPLGWTGERIIVTGDSAGGNLAASICIKAIMNGIRTPDILFCLYPVFNLSGHQSPSRLLSLIDPILNFNISQVCALAYAGLLDEFPSCPTKCNHDILKISSPSRQKTDFERLGQIIRRNLDHLATWEPMLSACASPLFASDDILGQFPFTYLFGCDNDPLLDDSIIMSKRLTILGVDHKFISMSGVPHGFITMRLADKTCDDAHTIVLNTLLQSLV